MLYDNSNEAVGLFSDVDLPKGACIGRTIRVYLPGYFNDWPIVAVCNHSPTPNVDFHIVAHQDERQLSYFGIAARDIKAGEELVADYTAPDAVSPNFANPLPCQPYLAAFPGEQSN